MRQIACLSHTHLSILKVVYNLNFNLHMCKDGDESCRLSKSHVMPGSGTVLAHTQCFVDLPGCLPFALRGSNRDSLHGMRRCQNRTTTVETCYLNLNVVVVWAIAAVFLSHTESR